MCSIDPINENLPKNAALLGPGSIPCVSPVDGGNALVLPIPVIPAVTLCQTLYH